MSASDPSPPRFTPFVPEETNLPELTVRAVLIGVASLEDRAIHRTVDLDD